MKPTPKKNNANPTWGFGKTSITHFIDLVKVGLARIKVGLATIL